MADDTNTAEREALMKLVDAYAEASFDQALHQRTEDDAPEAERKKLEKALRDALAGRASLAASAGSEPVAWMVPHLRTFKGATKVHFTRAPGCNMTDVELMEDLEGRVMWLPSTFSDSPGVTDKFGVHHKPKPLYTHPSPPEGMAGWGQGVEAAAALLSKKADDFVKEHGHDDMGGLSFGRGSHADAKLDYHSSLIELADEVRAMLPAPPLPASEAKEL